MPIFILGRLYFHVKLSSTESLKFLKFPLLFEFHHCHCKAYSVFPDLHHRQPNVFRLLKLLASSLSSFLIPLHFVAHCHCNHNLTMKIVFNKLGEVWVFTDSHMSHACLCVEIYIAAQEGLPREGRIYPRGETRSWLNRIREGALHFSNSSQQCQRRTEITLKDLSALGSVKRVELASLS